MSIILNLTILPLLALAAVILMYMQLGFMACLLIAFWRSFYKISNIQYVILYLVCIAGAFGLAHLIMKLSMLVVALAKYKMWGYLGSCIIFLFTTWKIIPQFISVALRQTDSR
jgi:hypothetical protein